MNVTWKRKDVKKGEDKSKNEGRLSRKAARKVVSSLGTAVSKDLMRDLTVAPGSEGMLHPLSLPLVRKPPGAFWDKVIRHQ